ncbi:MAG: fused MFS/spermidine synthase [Magnetococcales bacterium]|nr:fused MFS/spermidine synthase [Magnetococcales bacterium]MBF0116223.1 fused MFS/spermidine synthase [Magnetococcales bacterium]
MSSFRTLTLLYGLTLLLGAFLLFLVQPLSGKMILPWFGGSSAVWTTCLLFFQGMLLLGYLYAHALLRWLSPRGQSVLHLLLALVALGMLPLSIANDWKPSGDEDPLRHILSLLTANIALPYLLLAANSPLLQAWSVRHGQTQPYRLFALSNAGSLLALLAYPLLLEPWLTLPQQYSLWSALFALYLLLCAFLAILAGRLPQHRPAAMQLTAVRWSQAGLWLALSMAPSLLLLALTRSLTTDIAPVPLLWIVPLALYLLSFILAFDHPRWYKRTLFFPLLFPAFWVLLHLPVARNGFLALPATLLLLLLAATVLFMSCHGELARLRPAPEHLTLFYLLIALGGALGGLTAAVLAPTLFNDAYELPIAVVFCTFLAALVILPQRTFSAPWVQKTLYGGILLTLMVAVGQSVADWRIKQDKVTVLQRNFYGILSVYDSPEQGVRKLLHGRIIHGVQLLEAAKSHLPTTYYSQNSGVGRLLTAKGEQGPLRVGLVGLGIASLAAYGRSGDLYRFYELDPDLVPLARNRFSHLRQSPAQQEMVLGDARLQLERETANRFDVLVLDAFTGDAIPVHLLTLEALALYGQHLQEDGLLAVHVSNRYLELSWVVAAAARHLGWQARFFDDPGDATIFAVRSKWVVLARQSAPFAHDRLSVGMPIAVPAGFRPWDDHFAPLLSVLLR